MSAFSKWLKKVFESIYNLFLWASGAELEILKQTPTEKNKYFGIGGTIIFTALMASFAGGYAFFTAFKDTTLAIVFGIFWGALIFNLDRYIVSTFGVGDGKKTISKQEWIEAAPRLLMAVILGFVIATPLELKLFEKEINAEIAKNISIGNAELEKQLSEESNEIVTGYRNEISSLKKTINNREQILNNKRKEYEVADEEQRREWIGEGPTGKKGKGPYWDELNSKAQRLLNELNSIESEYLVLNKRDRAQIVDLQTKVSNYENQKISEIESNKRVQEQNDGLMARLKALSSLTDNNPSLLFARWLITLLFIFVEIAPILFKMMTERGPYDDILDRIKHEAKVKQLLLQSNLNQEINAKVKINADKTALQLNSELLANKSLLESIVKAQAEIAQVAINEWKEEQKKKVQKNPGTMIKS
jgi:hypothetical protein